MQSTIAVNEKRAELHRKAPPMKVKIFGYLAVFVAFTLGVLWFFETVMLEDIYQSVQYSQLTSSARVIAAAARLGSAQAAGENIAQQYQICSRVFSITEDGDGEYSGVETASTHIRDFCLIHTMSSDEINRLYYYAKNSDSGEYTERMSFGAFHKSSDESDSGIPDLLIGAQTVTGADGAEYFILVSAPLSPVDAIAPTLTLILTVVSFILVFFAAAVAIVIAGRLSAPIIFMNNAAAELARGNYDVRFTGGRGEDDLSRFLETEQLGFTLDHAAKELGQVDRLQKELIANIGHDLRTPLTMIRGYGEVMRDIPGEMTGENIQVIIDETDRLSSLVSDVLDMSKLQSGGIPMNPTVFDLTEMLTGTLERYKKLTERDGYNVTVKADARVTVRADRTRLLQVVYNLMNNAVNYAGEDKTVLVKQTVREEGGAKFVRVEVIDHGEGIDRESLPYIWDRYYRVDRVHKRAAIGSGLGLSIVRGVLEAHGAKYGVESEPGKGSTFWFELPAAGVAELG